jgi:hypothetical protein
MNGSNSSLTSILISKEIKERGAREKDKITVLINVAVLLPGLTSGIEAP